MRAIYGRNWRNFTTALHLPAIKEKPTYVIAPLILTRFLSAKGYSLGGHNKTRIHVHEYGLGVEWRRTYNDGKWTLGIGIIPLLCDLETLETCPYIPELMPSTRLGLEGCLNCMWCPKGTFVVTSTLGYSYAKFGAPRSTTTYTGYPANVSGISLGLGIGFRF